MVGAVRYIEKANIASVSGMLEFEQDMKDLKSDIFAVDHDGFTKGKVPTGLEYISGTQDHIGLLVPGITRINYNGKYWPNHIENTIDKETCEWLTSV